MNKVRFQNDYLSKLRKKQSKTNQIIILKEALSLLSKYPRDIHIREYVAQLYYMLQEYRNALKQYEILLEYSPDFRSALVAKAHLLRLLDMNESAKLVLIRLDSNNIQDPTILTEWLYHSKIIPLTLTEIGYLKNQCSESIRTELALLTSKLLRSYGEALFIQPIIVSLLDKNPKDFRLIIELCRICQDLKLFQKALDFLEDSKYKSEDNLSELYFEKAQCYRLMNMPLKAKPLYQSVHELDVNNPLPLTSLALIELESGNIVQAIQQLELISNNYTYDEADFLLAQCYIMNRKIDKWFETMTNFEKRYVKLSSKHSIPNAINKMIGLYLANKLNEAISLISICKMILTDDRFGNRYFKIYFFYLYKLLQWRAENQELFGSGKEDGLLHVIGESHALCANYALAEFTDKRVLRCVSHWLPGCKQWHLSNTHLNK